MDEWTHWARDVDPDPLSAEQMIPTEPPTLNAENFRIDILSVIMLGKKRIFFGLSVAGVVTCLG